MVSALPTSLWQLPKSLSRDNSVLPTNLRWLVDEADGRAHDDPLNEVGDGLVDCQRKANVQVDVVVDREGADGERPMSAPRYMPDTMPPPAVWICA